MKKTLSYLFLVIALGVLADDVYAQTPKIPGTHWSFDNHTMYDAVLSGELFINGESMMNVAEAEYLEIGAFCGDECRGSYLPDDVQLPFYTGFAYQMQIYSNVASGEEITFRIYDHLTETELDVICNSPIVFSANNVYGDLMDPFHLDFTLELPESYEITVSANPADGGTVEGGGTYIHGESATLTATASAGYDFINWTKGNQVVSTEPSFTFQVTEDGDYVANFEEIIVVTYEVTVAADPADLGTVTGGGTYEEGETVTITATPAIECTFINWTENGTVVSEDPEFTFVIAGNRNFVAHFDFDSVIEISDSKLNVYPNPVVTELVITNESAITSCEIYTITGEMVYNLSCNTTNVVVNVENLTAGSYIVRIAAEGTVQTRRFIKE